ncbi:MAG: mechanosensitive ion channel [Candidatus Omnitrophica bacterium]|nr:mechanosensitive ion channel [Candidatus Omnitrophota bacterium]MDD5592526.1 mechanosensitive ion channel [Candidatus Omnitrophota bacterium]
MFDKISHNINVIIRHNAFPKILVSFVIVLVTVILTKIVAVSLYHLQRRIIAKFKKVGMPGAAAIETRITIIRRIIETGIYLFAFIIFLQQFPAMRHIGTALLASAGIAGIVIGMAAQNTLSNIIGGICISFAQPVRLDDAVIFRNDWGWVEEIALMHTIIRTWDNRRIVVPNNVLVNEVIENWTIKDPSLLGVIMIYVDYTCDVDKIKGWVKEIVAVSQNSTSERIGVVEVVDFTEKSMALRILCKASDATKAWDLRCEIREKLIRKFKQEGLPLPQIRIAREKAL